MYQFSFYVGMMLHLLSINLNRGAVMGIPYVGLPSLLVGSLVGMMPECFLPILAGFNLVIFLSVCC